MRPFPKSHLSTPARRYWTGAVMCLALALFLAACQSGPVVPTAAPQATRTAAVLPPAATEPPAATATATQPPAPTATHTAVPTATPTPLEPLTIAAMRQRAYPGSPITIEETLAPGSNYARYYVSYLSEGLKIYALLTVPNGERPATGWPVVIFNHGYIAPNVYRTTERYVAYVDGFARSGYIVLRSDYRGHDRSEGEAHGAYGSPDYTVDVLNAVAAIKQYPDADPARIGMWGHSMGGYITLRAMVISQDIRAGVIWAGVVASYPDLISRWRRGSGTPAPTFTPVPGATTNPSRRWRNSLIERYGTPEENPDFWASISSNSYLADLSGPVQLHHGTADTSVPVEFSQDLYAQLTSAGQTAEYYEYPGDNHNLSASFGAAMARSIAFFDKYVKGDGL